MLLVCQCLCLLKMLHCFQGHVTIGDIKVRPSMVDDRNIGHSCGGVVRKKGEKDSTVITLIPPGI